MKFGSVIFGDNQFLGVNHSNQKKTMELFEKFKNPDAIIETLGYAYDAGIRDFMFTTHDRYHYVFDEIRRSNLFPEMYYSPCLPYAHKYWNKLSDKGVFNLLTSTIMQVNPINILPATLKLILGNYNGLVHLLTKIEILMCKGLPIRGIFLQNLAFDLLMAVEAYKVIEDFSYIVTDKLGVIPGFITMNLPSAVRILSDEIGINQPCVVSPVNETQLKENFLLAA